MQVKLFLRRLMACRLLAHAGIEAHAWRYWARVYPYVESCYPVSPFVASVAE